MDEKIVQKTKAIVKGLADRVPSTLSGLEKQLFIAHELIGGHDEYDRVAIKDFFDTCLVEMREREASDIDLGGWGAKDNIWLRIQGIKKPVPEFGVFTMDEFDILIQSLLMEAQLEHLFVEKNLDFSYNFRTRDRKILRHRANAYFELDSLALNMRAIHTLIRPMDSYGFHHNVLRVLNLAHSKEGLSLVTGITGSGKSTTLDSIVEMNNVAVDAHIIIIASPVEYVHTSKRCLIRHREVGRDTTSFKQGTIEALRQDPDIIIIGEMRDPATIMAALEVADSGHKVLSTLHTSSAIESIDRIIGESSPIEQERVRNRLADLLRCVISQKLVPSTGGRLILAKEILIMTPSIRAAIKNHNTGEIYQMINEGVKFGMVTMEQDLKQLVVTGSITRETAMNFANNKRMMQQLLQRI